MGPKQMHACVLLNQYLSDETTKCMSCHMEIPNKTNQILATFRISNLCFKIYIFVNIA